MKRLDVVPVMTRPVGWMKCVACSDFRTQPGRMWLGYSPVTGTDYTIMCPACRGTGHVERFKQIDLRSGKEIDYERPGQQFVNAVDQPGQILITG